MTPKQEREWAKSIMERIRSDYTEVALIAIPEFAGLVKGLAENEKYIDKAFARKVTNTFENVLWLREWQKGEITKEEFWKRIDDKVKAESGKRVEAFEKRLDRKLNPPRKKRKKRPVSGSKKT